MSSPPVHWHEGMFLRPQHFQAAQRHWAHLVQQSAKWDVHCNWGLRSLELDPEALANFRCVVRSLEARLRDGTIVVVSDDQPLAPVSLRKALEQNSSVIVYLGVPVFRIGLPNAQAEAAAEQGRYLVDTLELEDENTGQNQQPIPVRRLHLKLLLSSQPLAGPQALSGYDVVPLARLHKSSRPEATPVLDEKYIPPVLACDAWRPLGFGILQALYERIAKKMELLADQVVSRGLTFESNSQGDALTFNQLRELNQAYTTLGVLAFAQGIHPALAYRELCRLAGQLSIFAKERRPPDLPKYDHDDLALCFFQVRQHLDTLLDVFVEPQYRERSLRGEGFRMQASLESAWLESGWQMYLGVHGRLPEAECVQLLTKGDSLNMKIGSSDRVDTIFLQGAAGLRFTHVAHPPRALPLPQGQVYFQVLREANNQEWQHVQRSLTLAIRLNEKLIEGDIKGKHVVNIRHGGQTVPLQFVLRVLVQEAV